MKAKISGPTDDRRPDFFSENAIIEPYLDWAFRPPKKTREGGGGGKMATS